MRFLPAVIPGVVVIEPEPTEDGTPTGWMYSAEAFCAHGLEPTAVQWSVALNHRRGTLRGLHYQRPPHEESKVMTCIRGALYVVAADIRPTSPTCGQHVGVELRARDRRALYVPKGFAVGYQTLVDDTEVMYAISTYYAPGFEAGIHHGDPTLAIAWPLPVAVISERDRELPLLSGVAV